MMKLLLNPLSVPAQVTSPFGYRTDPIKHTQKLHTGADFDSMEEQPSVGLMAIASGTVLKARNSIKWRYIDAKSIRGVNTSNYAGNYIYVECGDRVVYGHNHAAYGSIKKFAGHEVKEGEALGIMGTSGYSTGAHDHFELWIDGTPVDPLPYLTGAKKLPCAPAIKSKKAFVKGASIVISNKPVYQSSDMRQPVKNISGGYRLVDAKIINGRVRITTSKLPAALLKVSSTAGWVKVSDFTVL